MIVNDHAIHVCALRRSGHHAVVQWMLANSGVGDERRVCFLNNAQPRTNPYVTARESLLPDMDLAAERAGRWSRKALLIANCEDRPPSVVYPEWFSTALTTWIGPSRRLTAVLILRDPFNLLASKCRWAARQTWRTNDDGKSLADLPAAWTSHLLGLISVWKAHAREFLGITRHMPPPAIHLSYNRWFSDAKYRKSCALEIGLASSDKGTESVAPWGPNVWGESFDGMAYDGRAGEMRVLDRWKHFADDTFFRSLVRDRELVRLSERIFGALPETDILLPRP